MPAVIPNGFNHRRDTLSLGVASKVHWHPSYADARVVPLVTRALHCPDSGVSTSHMLQIGPPLLGHIYDPGKIRNRCPRINYTLRPQDFVASSERRSGLLL